MAIKSIAQRWFINSFTVVLVILVTIVAASGVLIHNFYYFLLFFIYFISVYSLWLREGRARLLSSSLSGYHQLFPKACLPGWEDGSGDQVL